MSTLHQELVSGPRIISTFDFGGSIDPLNPQAPAKEVRLRNETIDFLKYYGASGFVISTASVSGSPEGLPSNEVSMADALRQMTVGVLGVIMSNASPQSTATVMIKPEREGRFGEMVATLDGFVTLAKKAIPEMRELTQAERKDLKLFFKKSYKKF